MSQMHLANAIELERSDELLTGESFEIVRAWVTSGAGSHVWIAAHVMHDVKSFGHLMGDTIRHGAKAYASTFGIAETEALQAIVNGVAAELYHEFSKVEMIAPGSLN